MSALAFRPLTRDDFSLLSHWLSLPHVEPWWRESFDAVSVERRYGPSVDGLEPTEVFVVELDAAPIGMVQRYRLDDEPEWQRVMEATGTPPDAAGIDYLIGEEDLIGQGIGTEIIIRFVEETWSRYPDVPAVVVNVQQDNRRSWRSLEKAGFTRCWAGQLDSDDPSDQGPGYAYILERPTPDGLNKSGGSGI